MNGFSCDIETITPEVAKQWLKRNSQNRPVSESHCRSLARDMEQGDWSVCGSAIVFNIHGELIDGQHRLSAVVKSGCPIESPVMKGISDDQAFMYIDQGKKRSAADVMSTVGKSKSTTRAAATKLVYQMVRSSDLTQFRLSNQRVANKTLFEFESSLPEIEEAVEWSSCFNRFSTRAVISSAMIILMRIDYDQARNFFERLHEGIFPHHDHPILRLRDALIMKRNPSLHREILMDLAMIFKTWNLSLSGKTIKVLQWRQDKSQRFPSPKGFDLTWRK